MSDDSGFGELGMAAPPREPDEEEKVRTRQSDLEKAVRQFSSAMSRAFAQAITGGKQFDDVLKTVALSLSKIALQNALKPLGKILTGELGKDDTGEGIMNISSFASGSNISAPASISVQIATPDADSFRRSEAYVTGQIARAVARGQRGL